MNNSFLIRISAGAAALSLVALTSTAAAGGLPRPLGAGEQPLAAGVHVLDLVSREQGRPGYKHLPRIAVTLPSGWFNNDGWAVNDGGALGLGFWDPDKVYPTGCHWQGKPKIDPGRTVAGLAQVLATRPLRHAGRPRNTELAGFRGKYLRWSVPSKINISRCSQGYFESWTGRGWATDRWQQGPGQVDRLWILDINGKRLVIDANYLPDATRKERTELDRIVHSIRFLSASSPRSPAAAGSVAAATPVAARGCAQFKPLKRVFPRARASGFSTRTAIEREAPRGSVFPGFCVQWFAEYHAQLAYADVGLALYRTHRQAIDALAEPDYGPVKRLADGALVRTDDSITYVNGVPKRALGVASVYRNVMISSLSIADRPISRASQLRLHRRMHAGVRAMARR